MFREKGREKERVRNTDVREKHQSVASYTLPARGLAHNPGTCPDQESKWRSLFSPDDAQPTEPHQSGLS